MQMMLDWQLTQLSTAHTGDYMVTALASTTGQIWTGSLKRWEALDPIASSWIHL